MLNLNDVQFNRSTELTLHALRNSPRMLFTLASCAGLVVYGTCLNLIAAPQQQNLSPPQFEANHNKPHSKVPTIQLLAAHTVSFEPGEYKPNSAQALQTQRTAHTLLSEAEAKQKRQRRAFETDTQAQTMQSQYYDSFGGRLFDADFLSGNIDAKWRFSNWDEQSSLTQAWSQNHNLKRVNKNDATWPVKFSPNRAESTTSTQKTSQYKNNKTIIMLDPGHGGADPGTIGFNGVLEKEVTYEVARRARAILARDDNIQVVLSRKQREGLSRDERVKRVRETDADLLISLHLNHLPRSNANIVETYYATSENIQESREFRRRHHGQAGLLHTNNLSHDDFDFTSASKRLAEHMQKHIYSVVRANNPETEDAGVKQDTLFILTRTYTPSVLIELSCLSNTREAQSLYQVGYLNKLAQALANGIREYVNTSPQRNDLDA